MIFPRHDCAPSRSVSLPRASEFIPRPSRVNRLPRRVSERNEGSAFRMGGVNKSRGNRAIGDRERLSDTIIA
jgi:hypothetical protein